MLQVISVKISLPEKSNFGLSFDHSGQIQGKYQSGHIWEYTGSIAKLPNKGFQPQGFSTHVYEIHPSGSGVTRLARGVVTAKNHSGIVASVSDKNFPKIWA